jgi:hypothetical protein
MSNDFWTMFGSIGTWIGVFLALVAVILAWKGLRAMREEVRADRRSGGQQPRARGDASE